jgi:hypothetical protein
MTYHYRVRSIDRCGNENVSEDYTFTIDTIAPAISDVLVSGKTESSSTITWATDEASTSQVEYGTSTSYGSASSLDATLLTSHSMGLSGLSIGATYHFRVKSKDAAGNEAVSGDYSFTTLGTLVGGIISENTTWTKAGSPYLITDTVQIPLGVKLTIEPGVTVMRPKAHGCMFLVHGEVYAHGTVDERITFDGGSNSDFFTSAGSTIEAFVDLEYCIIGNGLALWPPTPNVAGGYFSLRHSELIDLRAYSYLPGSPQPIYIEYNTFKDTAGFIIGSGDVYIRYNLFDGYLPDWQSNSDFFIGSYGGHTVVSYNSFLNMSGVVLELVPGYVINAFALSAPNNYWATQDTALIDAMIYDKNDDITCAGYIDYLPILTAPHPDTPTP